MRGFRRAALAGAVAAAFGACAFANELAPVALDALCVSDGAIQTAADGGLSIDAPSARATLRALTAPAAEIEFRYLGPSAEGAPSRQQIGIDLSTQDDCNRVEVDWRIEPEASVAVSVKSNPGRATLAQCGGAGDVAQKPAVAKAAMAPGERHRLRAELDPGGLRVFADGAEVWRGALAPRAAMLAGPVGLSADNARFDFTFLAPAGGGAASTAKCQPPPAP